MNVLISGAGIAGPTLAYWLLRFGHDVTLVESAPWPRTGGYIVDFWGAGFDVAEKMGLIPRIKESGYKVKEVRFVGEHGERVGGFDAEILTGAAGGRFVSVPRSELALAIYDTVANRCEALFGERITRIVRRNGRANVSFQGTATRTFDLVVGADGLHSGVRDLTWGEEGRVEHYLGYKAAAFEAAGYPSRDELAFVSYGTPGKQIARFATRNGKTLFFFVFLDRDPNTPREPAAIRETLRRAFAGNGWESDGILCALDATNEIYFDRVSQIRLDAWSRDRIVLVGDAAACPSLLAGEGAALAMVASYVLAGELRLSKSVPLALAAYEARLRPLILAKQKAAARFASAFAPRTRAGLTIRNIVSKALHLPFVAEATLLPPLRDSFALPEYDLLARAA